MLTWQTLQQGVRKPSSEAITKLQAELELASDEAES